MLAEILVKVRRSNEDNYHVSKNHEDGSPVVWCPAGWEWTDKERKAFVVLRVDMDEAELDALCAPEFVEHGDPNEGGHKEVAKKRRTVVTYQAHVSGRQLQDLRDPDLAVDVIVVGDHGPPTLRTRPNN